VRREAELFVTTSYFYLGRFMRRARSYKTDQDLWKRSGRSTSRRPLTRRLSGTCRIEGPASRSIYGTMTLKDEGRSGTLVGYYWVRDVQSGPPLGPSRSKGSEAGCRLSLSSSKRSKCPPPRFVREDRATRRRRSVPNGDSRRVGVAESSRSTRARRGSVDVSEVMFGEPSRLQAAVEAVKDVRSERVVA
jgi:hypothetical protein